MSNKNHVSKNEYDKAQKIVNQYHKQRQEIDMKKHREEIAELVGNCYKFHNSYSDGKKWWMYTRVIGTKEDLMIVESIQKTSEGIIELIQKTEYIPEILTKRTPITEQEYREKTHEILSELEMLND